MRICQQRQPNVLRNMFSTFIISGAHEAQGLESNFRHLHTILLLDSSALRSLVRGNILNVICSLDILDLVQNLRLDLAPENIPVKEVGDLPGSVRGMLARRNAEDLIQLLERLALGFGHEEQDKEEADHVPRSIPTERTLRREGRLQRGPRDRENEVEEPRRRRCE